MKTRYGVLIALAVLLGTGASQAVTLGVNVLSNGNFSNTGGASTPFTQPEMGAGWWTNTGGFGVWSSSACGDAYWTNDAGGGNMAFWYPAITGYTWTNSMAANCGSPGVFPVDIMWYVDPAAYIALGANQVTIRLKVNMDQMVSGSDMLIQAATFKHSDNSNWDLVNDYVNKTTGTGWLQREYVLPLQAADTVAGFKLNTWDGVTELYTATALPSNAYAGDTFWMDDMEIIFEYVPPAPVCVGGGAGLGTELGANFDGLVVSKLPSAPTVDGSIANGEYATDPLVINNSSMNAAGSNPAGALDFLDCDSSAIIWLSWDDTNLYVAARVFDESVEYLANSPNLNTTDAIQIALDHKNLGAAGINGTTDGVYIFDLTPGTLANNAVAGFQQHWPAVPNAFAGATVASSLRSGGYDIEAQIPWANFSPAITPSAGAPMNYLAIMLDYDGAAQQGALINKAGGWGALGANAGGWNHLTLGGVSSGAAGADPIVSSITPGFIQTGDRLVLSAPAGSGYQWKFEGQPIAGQNARTLVLDPVGALDLGSYTVVYDNGLATIVETPVFVLTALLAAGSLPVAGVLGLALTAVAMGLGGAVLRRKK